MFVVIHCNYWKKINLKGEWCVHISFSFIRHFMIQIEWIDRMHHHHRPPYPFVFQSPTTNTISNFNPVFACVQNIRPSPNWLTSHHKKIKIKNKNKNRQTPLLQFLHSDHPSHCFTVIHPTTHRLPLLVYIYIYIILQHTIINSNTRTQKFIRHTPSSLIHSLIMVDSVARHHSSCTQASLCIDRNGRQQGSKRSWQHPR